MKIEKVNENQIRCTLTKQDLADRQINLRELAYGSEKAKGLFHDMIQQANYEFGQSTYGRGNSIVFRIPGFADYKG